MKQNNVISKNSILLIVGIMLVAFNLRAPITSVGPLAGLIRADLGISNALVGFIMTVSLLTFAVFSPVAAKIGSRIGNERAIFTGLLIVIFGECIRSSGQSEYWLFGGTTLIGIGIAIGNVLIPSVIKNKFPDKIGLLVSIYTTSMTVLAAIGAGISMPLADMFQSSWRTSLLCWCILAIIAVCVWAPQLRNKGKANNTLSIKSDDPSVWTSPLAWCVSIFMGLQCLLLYSVIAWLPDILCSQGLDRISAGWMLFFFQFVSMPASFMAPIIAGRIKDQRRLAVISGCLCLIGLIGLLFGGNIIVLGIWLAIFSTGGGACFSLAFVFMGLRTSNAAQAAELSGMAQFIGYLMAAIGPFLIGFLFDYTHSWTIPMFFFIITVLAIIGISFIVGRHQYIFQQKQKY